MEKNWRSRFSIFGLSCLILGVFLELVVSLFDNDAWYVQLSLVLSVLCYGVSLRMAVSSDSPFGVFFVSIGYWMGILFYTIALSFNEESPMVVMVPMWIGVTLGLVGAIMIKKNGSESVS